MTNRFLMVGVLISGVVCGVAEAQRSEVFERTNRLVAIYYRLGDQPDSDQKELLRGAFVNAATSLQRALPDEFDHGFVDTLFDVDAEEKTLNDRWMRLRNAMHDPNSRHCFVDVDPKTNRLRVYLGRVGGAGVRTVKLLGKSEQFAYAHIRAPRLPWPDRNPYAILGPDSIFVDSVHCEEASKRFVTLHDYAEKWFATDAIDRMHRVVVDRITNETAKPVDFLVLLSYRALKDVGENGFTELSMELARVSGFARINQRASLVETAADALAATHPRQHVVMYDTMLTAMTGFERPHLLLGMMYFNTEPTQATPRQRRHALEFIGQFAGFLHTQRDGYAAFAPLGEAFEPDDADRVIAQTVKLSADELRELATRFSHIHRARLYLSAARHAMTADGDTALGHDKLAELIDDAATAAPDAPDVQKQAGDLRAALAAKRSK